MTGLAVLGALAAVMLKRQHQALGWAAAAFAGAAVLLLALDSTGEAYLQTNAEGAQAVRAHMDVPVQQR